MAATGAVGAVDYELPATVLEDDVLLLQNVLTALHSLGCVADAAAVGGGGGGVCVRYKVEPLLTGEGGYMVRGGLPTADIFELTLEDQLFLQGVSPARIASVALGRAAPNGPIEVFIRVLDARQRVMVQSSTCFHRATRKRARDSSA